LVVLACLMMNNSAQAAMSDLINIKFNTSTLNLNGVVAGAGYASGSNTYYKWNTGYTGVVSGYGGTRANLLTSDNRATSVGFSYTSDNYTGTTYTAFGPSNAPYFNLMRTFVSSTTVDDYFKFTGLDANATFNITVYTQAENNTAATQLALAVPGQLPPVSGSTIATSPTSSAFVSGKNYITLTAKSNASGVLTVDYTPLLVNGSNRAVINALQLYQSSGTQNGPVPEPATMVLLGIGGLLSAHRMKKLSINTQQISA